MEQICERIEELSSKADLPFDVLEGESVDRIAHPLDNIRAKRTLAKRSRPTLYGGKAPHAWRLNDMDLSTDADQAKMRGDPAIEKLYDEIRDVYEPVVLLAAAVKSCSSL